MKTAPFISVISFPTLYPVLKILVFFFYCNRGFEKQISAVVKLSFFHLRRLLQNRTVYSVKQLEQIIHLFVLSRLDYCNPLYYKAVLYNASTYGPKCSRKDRQTEVRSHLAPSYFDKLFTSQI